MLTFADFWGLTLVGLPATAALAAVALIGYLFGHRTRSGAQASMDEQRQRELERAARIAWQLETIADALRKELAAHHALIEAFKRRLRAAQEAGNEQSWQQLCTEAEAILAPTMQLAHQLSRAYDQLRQQSDALETFTHGRTDPLTGVGNARALDGQLRMLLSAAQGPADFAVAMVSLAPDSPPNQRVAGRRDDAAARLLPLANTIRGCMRDSDFVARLGDDELVVVMPQTSLAGASVFGDRLRSRVAEELGATICCGIATAADGDDAKSILARADSALYSAKAAGSDRQFVHTGTQIREHVSKRPPATCLPSSSPRRTGADAIAPGLVESRAHATPDAPCNAEEPLAASGVT